MFTVPDAPFSIHLPYLEGSERGHVAWMVFRPRIPSHLKQTKVSARVNIGLSGNRSVPRDYPPSAPELGRRNIAVESVFE